MRRRRLWWWTSGPVMRAILTAEEASLAVEDEGQPAPWTCSPGGGCTRSSSPCSPGAVPVASSSSERLFSLSGRLVASARNRFVTIGLDGFI